MAPTGNRILINAFESNDLQNRDFIFNENSRFFRDEEADSRNRGISGNWKYQSGANWQHHFNAGYNELNRDSWSLAGLEPNKQGKGGKEELDSDDNSLEEIIVNWGTSLKTGNFTHQFGIGANIDRVSYHYLAERSVGNVQIDSINYDSEINVLHAYFQEKIQLTESIHARVGIRANHASHVNKFYFQMKSWQMCLRSWKISFKSRFTTQLIHNKNIFQENWKRQIWKQLLRSSAGLLT